MDASIERNSGFFNKANIVLLLKYSIIILIFMFSLVSISYISISSFTKDKSIYFETMMSLIIGIFAVYAFPLGIIIGGIASIWRKSLFWLVLIVSVTWNFIVAFPFFLFRFSIQYKLVDIPLTHIEKFKELSTPTAYFLLSALGLFFFSKNGLLKKHVKGNSNEIIAQLEMIKETTEGLETKLHEVYEDNKTIRKELSKIKRKNQ